MANLNDALNLAQEALERCYWDEEKQYYEHHFPRKEEEAFVYWWHAHTVDALLDGYLRTGGWRLHGTDQEGADRYLERQSPDLSPQLV